MKLNINEYLNNAAYTAQVKDLLARGCRINWSSVKPMSGRLGEASLPV